MTQYGFSAIRSAQLLPGVEGAAARYQRYEERHTGLVIPQRLGIISVVASTQRPEEQADLYVPSVLEQYILFGRHGVNELRDEFTEDTLTPDLEELARQSKTAWRDFLPEGTTATAVTHLDALITTSEEGEFQAIEQIANPNEASALRGIAEYIRAHNPTNGHGSQDPF